MQKEPGWKKDCSIASAPPYTHFWIIPGVSRLRQPSSGSLPRGRGSHAGNETFEKRTHRKQRLRPTTHSSPVSKLHTLHFQLPLALHLACDKKVTTR